MRTLTNITSALWLGFWAFVYIICSPAVWALMAALSGGQAHGNEFAPHPREIAEQVEFEPASTQDQIEGLLGHVRITNLRTNLLDDQSGSHVQMISVQTPDGDYIVFEYESTPGFPNPPDVVRQYDVPAGVMVDTSGAVTHGGDIYIEEEATVWLPVRMYLGF